MRPAAIDRLLIFIVLVMGGLTQWSVASIMEAMSAKTFFHFELVKDDVLSAATASERGQLSSRGEGVRLESGERFHDAA